MGTSNYPCCFAYQLKSLQLLYNSGWRLELLHSFKERVHSCGIFFTLPVSSVVCGSSSALGHIIEELSRNGGVGALLRSLWR